MTIQNRDTFLNHLATRLGRSRRIEGVTLPKWSLEPQKKVMADLSQDELINILKKECESIYTQFELTSKENLNDVLRKVINQYNAQSLVVAKDSRNQVFGLNNFYTNLRNDGFNVHYWDPDLGNEENIAITERMDIGITFSEITLAESATVVLMADKNKARTITLLPKIHISIIPKSTIVPRLTQAATQIHDAFKKEKQIASSINFISGPSNSGDIEMNLVVGVHGPIHATYIVVED